MATAARATRGQRLREQCDQDLALAYAVADLTASEPESPVSETYRPPKRARRTVRPDVDVAANITALQQRSHSLSTAAMLAAERKHTRDNNEQAARRVAALKQHIQRLGMQINVLKDKLVFADETEQRCKKAVTAHKVAQGKYSRSKQQVCKLHAQVQSLQHSLQQARNVAKAALAIAAQRTAVAQPCQPQPQPQPRSALEVAAAVAQRRTAAAAAAP